MSMLSDRFARIVWTLFRIVLGLLFACHGLASLFGVLGGSRGSGEPVPFGIWPNWYAAVIQLACGVLVLVGLLTRPAAILASGSMAYAYFMVHQEQGLFPIQNGGVTPALYSWSFLLVAAVGAGPLAIDALFRRSRTQTPEVAAVPEKSEAAAVTT
jgi:putative oxidoreductase